MKVSTEWLNDYFSTKFDAKSLADKFNDAGIEVEQIIDSKRLDSKIIIAEIKKVIQHPNADRLKIVRVQIPDAELQIVCGAPNVHTGQTVALAQVGTVLPDGTEIGRSKIRGIESEGMLCSGRELGLDDDHAGLAEFDKKIILGTPLCDIVNSSYVLDVTTPANRADLLSMNSLAREIATKEKISLAPIEHVEVIGKYDSSLVVEIQNKAVREYKVAHVKLGKTGESPQWMKQRLMSSGFRPINAVVDITNYVMLETGQPLHAFDANNVELPISARSPRHSETLTTLDGNSHKLDSNDLVIADNKGPLGLAGVLGGLASQIIDETNEIYLESANFDGAVIRRMANRHGSRTDASSRFERNLPLPLVNIALRRALELLEEYCDAKLVALSSENNPKYVAKTLEVDLLRIKALLGFDFSVTDAKTYLKCLGFELTGKNNQLLLTIPWWRLDVSQEADIAEEIGRSIGYAAIPATLPSWQPTELNFDVYWSSIWQLKSILRSLGYDEVSTYSFVSEDQLLTFNLSVNEHLKLQNPLSIEQAYLRSQLALSLVDTIQKNARNFPEFGIYEISKVFIPLKDHTQQPVEELRLGICFRGDNGFIKVKSVIDTIGQIFEQLNVSVSNNDLFKKGTSGNIMQGPHRIGTIGELNPELMRKFKIAGHVWYAELTLLPWLLKASAEPIQSLSKYPSITRDVSILLPKKVLWAQISETLAVLKIAKVAFLSEYLGNDISKNVKSITFRLTFNSPNRTLQEKEADDGVIEVIETLKDKFQAQLRQ
ncbi:MAG: phenylalanine--tRNA ligase subunit beta [Candidatus Saccharimonadia bacterium]